MSPKEIRETLFRTLDKLDEIKGDKTDMEQLLRAERNAHERDIAARHHRHRQIIKLG